MTWIKDLCNGYFVFTVSIITLLSDQNVFCMEGRNLRKVAGPKGPVIIFGEFLTLIICQTDVMRTTEVRGQGHKVPITRKCSTLLCPCLNLREKELCFVVMNIFGISYFPRSQDTLLVASYKVWNSFIDLDLRSQNSVEFMSSSCMTNYCTKYRYDDWTSGKILPVNPRTHSLTLTFDLRFPRAPYDILTSDHTIQSMMMTEIQAQSCLQGLRSITS